METIKKQTIKLGNSAGVLLPREWLNSIVEVKLVKTPYTEEMILKDLNKILKDYFKNILGIYLTGSYARGDYDEKSDIDVLVITDKINKIINIENYEIFLISEDNLIKRLSKSLYLASSVKETKTLINQSLIKRYKEIKIDIDIKEILKEIERILQVNKEIIETAKEHKKNVPDGTIYSLVLRFRELYMIDCLLKNKKINKKEFTGLVSKNIYDVYSRVKRDEGEVNDINPKKAEEIYELSIKWLKDLKD